MASKGKMNKAQQRARIEELENKIEEWQEIGSQYGDAFETPQDIVYRIEELKEALAGKAAALVAAGDELEVARSVADLCNATNADNNEFREKNKILQYKVELFEKHVTDPRKMICPTVFADFLSEENEEIYEGGDCHILEGFHWELVKDGETNEEHLQLVKNKVSQIKKWEESGDANPQLLLNAIAEKLGLKPIDWGQEGADEQSYELWDKIADTMNEP